MKIYPVLNLRTMVTTVTMSLTLAACQTPNMESANTDSRLVGQPNIINEGLVSGDKALQNRKLEKINEVYVTGSRIRRNLKSGEIFGQTASSAPSYNIRIITREEIQQFRSSGQLSRILQKAEPSITVTR